MAKESKYVETPLMKQYYAIKATHPDAILLFRVGDFYETFGEDAIRASEILGITLTRRANGSASYVELAGFPYHALDVYMPKLVRAGQRVAICEQLEDPKATKSIVRRGVTELVTPGITFNDNILSHRENSFLASVYFGGKGVVGVSFLDVSTGEFFAAEGNAAYVDKLISGFSPKEIIYQRGREAEFSAAFGDKHYTYRLEEWIFSEETNRQKLLKHFGVPSLKGYGIDSMPAAIAAAGAIIYYLDFTEHKNMGHISSISRLEEDKYVWLDKYSIRNLELFSSIAEGGTSLAEVIDRTISPMGSRMLKRWISLPLKDINAINDRLDVVDYFKESGDGRIEQLSDILRKIGDLERIVSKVAVCRANPREVVQLGHALEAISELMAELSADNIPALDNLVKKLNPCVDIRERIARTLAAEPATAVGKGNVIAEGVDPQLDDLRNIASHGKEYLLNIQQREIEATGITSLKIGYNNVFGYYIEVRNTHKDKVPTEWIRKQTLVGAERYITEELKEYEAKILGAQDKILVIEQRLFAELISVLQGHIHTIQTDAALVACIDCLLSFAMLAMGRGQYCRPEINDSRIIDIKEGRHPVIESRLPHGEVYIPNDVYLDSNSQQIIMITGPNMAGKSALLRQTALIVLMAQIGCYVPAAAASIGIVDKIFTRVGASDNISQGESTFMVEMLESSNILNNISDRSLVLLDEIGRGTSTYDGISIAWAMVEYLHQTPRGKAKCLFATHYHELNEMSDHFPRIRNFNVSVKEIDKRIIFLRKLTPGGTEHSFGIHVAKMAGMPREVIGRAEDILKTLEGRRQEMNQQTPKTDVKSGEPAMQLSFFQLEDPVLLQIRSEIKGIDINNLTPVEALLKLNEIKKISGL